MKLSRCLCIAALSLMVGCAPLRLKADGMPPIEQARQEGTIAYHIRSGRHEVMPYDWEQYVKFADKYLK